MICGIYLKAAGPTGNSDGNHGAVGALTTTLADSMAMSRSFPGGNLWSRRVFLALSLVALYVGVLASLE